MIVDTIANLEIYAAIQPDLHAGLLYLRGLQVLPPIGEIQVSERVRAIVASYRTTATSDGVYEAHRTFIDVHYPLRGRERIDCSPVVGMTLLEEYDADKDRTLYMKPGQRSEIIVGDGAFAVLFPGDAHRPGLAAGEPEQILKVTLKVRVPEEG